MTHLVKLDRQQAGQKLCHIPHLYSKTKISNGNCIRQPQLLENHIALHRFEQKATYGAPWPRLSPSICKITANVVNYCFVTTAAKIASTFFSVTACDE